MLLPEKNIFSNKALKICAALLPRTAVLLVLLTQQPFLAHMFAGSSYGTLYALIIADLLICAAYVIITARAGRTDVRALPDRGPGPEPGPHFPGSAGPAAAEPPARRAIPALDRLRQKFGDTLFFLWSLFAFYFIDYISSDLRPFIRNSSPFENILFMLMIQLVCLGFFFTGMALRRGIAVFKRRPWSALVTAAGICGLSFLARDAVLIPLLGALNTISPHVAAFAAVFYCLALFYLLLAGLYGCYKTYIATGTPPAVILTAVCAAGLPLAILLVGATQHSGSLFWSAEYLAPGLFGPALHNNLFWSGLFLALAGLITAAHTKNSLVRRALFILLGASLPLTLYLCLVLLPFLCVIFVFVLFDPLFFVFFLPYVLLAFHIRALWDSSRAFESVFPVRPAAVTRPAGDTDRAHIIRRTEAPTGPARLTPRIKTLLVFICLLCLLPGFVSFEALTDKAGLYHAYDGMYTSGQIEGIDADRLQRVLQEFGSRSSDYMPLISPLRRLIILGDKKLNERQSARLLAFYLGGILGGIYEDDSARNRAPWPRLARLKSLREVAYVEHESYMQSKVLVRVENPTRSQDEFYARFELPPGVFITGLTLWIDGSERRGVLSSKEPALMTYNSITYRLRDPALLMYEDDGSCSLRIFPVEPGKERLAAVTFMYQRPFTLSLGGSALSLGRKAVTWAEAGAKKAAPPDAAGAPDTGGTPVPRTQVLHFIIDYSASNQATPAAVEKLVTACIDKLGWRGPVRFTAANYNWINYDSLDGLCAGRALPQQGSFVYSRVLYGLLREYEKSGEYPRFVFVSHEKKKWLVHTSLAPAKINFPGLRRAYRLDTDGGLYAFPAFHITDEAACGNILNGDFTPPAFAGSHVPPPPAPGTTHASAALLDVQAPDRLLRHTAPGGDQDGWEQNALLFTEWCREDAALQANYARRQRIAGLDVLARQRGLLLPGLSYIVLENAEQERMLKEASDHDGNGALLRRAELETVAMDEGPDYIIVAILILLAGFTVAARRRAGKNRG